MMDLDALLKEVVELSATDLYLVVGAVPCLNIDGHFAPPPSAEGHRLTPDQVESFAREMMSERQWRSYLKTNEANLAYMSAKRGRFRVNAFRQRGVIGLVLRRVVMNIPTLRSLKLDPILRDIALADRGIVLVTGSTGSGKSTSMASMIDYRNHLRSGHIVTIEDPIEFVYQHRRSILTQREIGMDTLSYEEALKNSMRQAPQVISIGEMRDYETLRFALHAAETGHLVLATLHSTTATLAIERVLHFYPNTARDQAQLQLALNLKAVICQRLLPNLEGGRICASEILINTPRIESLILKGDMHGIAAALGEENNVGIVNFNKALYKLVKQDQVSEDAALRAADSENELKMKFRGFGIEKGSSWEDLSDPWEEIEGDYTPPESWMLTDMTDLELMSTYSNEQAPPMSIRQKANSNPSPEDQPATSPTAPVKANRSPVAPPAKTGRVVQRYQDMIDHAMGSSNDTDLDDELDI